MIDITKKEEVLLERLGIPWNAFQYELQDFTELNFELEANGVPTYASFEEYLEGRLEYKQRKAA